MARAFIPHVITPDKALGGMEIEKSIKFNNHSSSADDAQLYRTVGTTSNRKTYTHSFWAKRSKRTGGIVYGVTDNSGSYFHYFLFESSDKLTINEYRYNESPSNKIRYRTNRYFRDLNSWYHFVVAIDTTQSTAGDRQKIYVNGERLDSFEISVNPNQNLDTYINSTSPYSAYRIGLAGWGYSGFNGQLAEYNFIDGLALDPSHFGFTESQTGIWKPKKYISPSVDHFNWALNNNITDALNGTAFTENGGSSSFVSAGSNSFGLTNCLDISGGKYLSYAIAPASQWTIDFYVKLDNFTGANSYIGGWNGTGGSSCCVGVNKDNAPNYYFVVWGGSGNLYQTAVTVSLNTWYHIRITSNATNDLKLYIDGTLRATDTSSNQNPATPLTFGDMQSGRFDGQIAGVRYITRDLGAPPSGGLVSTNGVLPDAETRIKYGTNGFHLEFKDPSNLGRDTSGNGNNFTQDNLTGTSNDHTNDSMPDTPTNNFVHLSELDSNHQCGGTSSTQEAGYRATCTTAGGGGNLYPFMQTYGGVRSGKYYAEFKSASGQMAVGVCNRGKLDSDNTSNPYGADSPQSIIYTDRAELRTNNGNISGSFAGYAVGDVIGVALDADNMKVYFSKNGTYINGQDGSNQQNPETGYNGFNLVTLDSGNASYLAFHVGSDGATNITVDVNFGQRAFAHTKPTGYRTFKYKEFPDNPTKAIIRPQRHFDTVLYSGNDGTQSITGLEFPPDFVWIKMRSHSGDNHHLYDSVRGPVKTLFSNTTSAEQPNDTDRLTSFDNNGFTLGNNYRVNGSGKTFVAWCWKAGGGAVANTDGSITTQVSANQEAGFSIISYSGTDANGTIGHGLGRQPKWVIVKKRNGSQNWFVYHPGSNGVNSTSGANRDPRLNDNASAYTTSNIWNNTHPTSSVIHLGSSSGVNGNGDTYICYAWAEIPGFSQFGSYTGSGNNNGTYVFTDFKPAWLMVKRVDGTGDWAINDIKRDFNGEYGNDKSLYANGTGGDTTSSSLNVDLLGNGFCLRSDNAKYNAENGQYIYMAFADQPRLPQYDSFPSAN